MHQQVHEFYAQPAAMTAAGPHANLLAALPDDLARLVRVVQQLVVYDVVAADFYGFAVPEERQFEIHLRSLVQKLDRLRAIDDRPLLAARPVERRLLGRCHHYTLLLVALLRARGVPARARCGFAWYFNPPYGEDHWVCEYWNNDDRRWVLVDAQLDAVWRAKLGFAHDILDVPHDQFLVAGEAWALCRSGQADPARFGIGFVPLRGLWYIAANVVRDVAALNKLELLPWDTWGAQPAPDTTLTDAQLAFFDEVAALTCEPERGFDALRERFATDPRLSVPGVVFNGLLDRPEVLPTRADMSG
jgi:hypothetical protein